MISFLLRTKTVSENKLRAMSWRARFFGSKKNDIPGTREQKTGAYYLTVHEMQKRKYLLDVSKVELIRFAPRRLDDDNLRGALKAVRDGVAEAIGIDDGDSKVKWGYDQEKSQEYGVYVKILEKGDPWTTRAGN